MAERNAKGQFTKGHSGHPGGRTKAKKDYRALLDAACSNAAWRAIIKRAIADAKNGDRYARQWLSDYDWGKPIQGVKVTGNLGFTLTDWEQRAEQRLKELGENEDTSISEQPGCEGV